MQHLVFALALLLQATAAPSMTITQIAQYVADAAAVGAFVFAYRTNGRLIQLETLIMSPNSGLAPKLEGTSKQTHQHATVLQGHEVEIANSKREIERLDRDKEPRRAPLSPFDVGTPDRRGSDR